MKALGPGIVFSFFLANREVFDLNYIRFELATISADHLVGKVTTDGYFYKVSKFGT
jgi:hypothetical protein